MRKTIVSLMLVAAITIAQAGEYKTVSFIGCKNMVGTLMKQFTHIEDGSIVIGKDKVTITSYGDTKSYKIIEASNNKYTLDNGNVITVRAAKKSIRLDIKKQKSDEYFYYTYIFNIK